jgi:tRNA(His) 5'-end guanylyltransferase
VDPDLKTFFGMKGDPFPADAEKALYDTVSKPKHYMLFEEHGVEVRDVIERLVEKGMNGNWVPETPLFISDYVQMLQYVMRFTHKNGKEDLEKARWYLDKMIEAYDN